MEEFQTIYQLRKSISHKSQAWIIPALRMDPIIWRSLNEPTFLERAVKAANGSDEFWNPSNLGFLSVGVKDHLEPKSFPFLGLPPLLQKETLDLMERFKNRTSEIRDLREAALLAIWVNSESRNNGWKVVFDYIDPSNNPADLEKWKTSLGICYGFSDAPLEIINELKNIGADLISWDIICHILLIQPMRFEEQVSLIIGALKNTSVKTQIHVDKRLISLGFRNLSEAVARELITQKGEDFPTLIQKIKTQDVTNDPRKISDLKDDADLFSLAGETAKASQLLSEISNSIVEMKQQLDHKKETIDFDPRDELDQTNIPVDMVSQSLFSLINLKEEKNSREELEADAEKLVQTILQKKLNCVYEDEASVVRKLMLKALENLNRLNLVSPLNFLIENALDCFPNDTEILKMGINSAFRLDQTQKGIEYSNLYLALHPEDMCEKKRLANALEKDGNPRLAYEEWMDILHQSSSPSLEVVKKTAEMAFNLDDFIQAESLCSDILTQNQDDESALTMRGICRTKMGLDLQGENDLTHTLQVNPLNDLAWNGLINLYIRQTNVQKRNLAINNGLNHMPDSAVLNYQKAKSLLEAHSYTEALPFNRKACKTEDAASEAISDYAETLEKLGLYDEEKRLFEKIGDFGENDLRLIRLRAQYCLREQNYPEVVRLLTPLVDEPDTEREIYLSIAEAVLNDVNRIFSNPSSEKDPLIEKIVAGLDKTLPYSENSFSNQINYARLLLEFNDASKAFALLKDLSTHTEVHSERWAGIFQASLGQAALQIGEHEVALAALKEADLLQPKDLRTKKSLALAHHLNHLTDDALEVADQIRALKPDHGTVLEWYSRFMNEIGKNEKALQGYEKLFEKDPMQFAIPYCRSLIEASKLLQAKKVISNISKNPDLDLAKVKEATSIAFELDDFPLAISIIEKCGEKYSNDLNLLLTKIGVFQKMGHLENAIHETDNAAALYPNEPVIYLLRANIVGQLQGELEALGDLLEAQRLIEKGEMSTLKSGPYDWQKDELIVSPVLAEDQLAYSISKIYLEKGQPSEAYIQIQKALRLNPDNIVYRYQTLWLADVLLFEQDFEQISGAIDHLQASSVNNRYSSADAKGIAGVFGLMANRAIEENDSQKEKQYIDLSITLDPSNCDGLTARIRSQQRDGQGQSARNDLASLSALHPESNEFSLALVESRQWKSALDSCRQNVSRKSQEPKTWLTLIKIIITILEMDDLRSEYKANSILQSMGESKENLKTELDKAFSSLKSLSQSPQINRWEIRSHLAISVSKDDLNKLLSIAISPEEFVVLANGFRKLGLRENLEKVVVQFPKFPALMLQHALALYSSDPIKAVEILDQILSMEQEDDLPFVLLAQIKAQRQDYADAISYLEKAIEIKDDEPEWHKRLAEWALKQNDPILEIAHLKKVVEISPVDIEMNCRLSEAYLKCKMPQNVFDVWKGVPSDNSGDPKKHIYFARAYQILGNDHECRNQLKSAVNFDKGDGRVYSQAAEILLEGMDPVQAFDYARIAVVRDTNNPKAIVLLSKVTALRQSPKDALVLLDKVVGKCSQDPTLLIEKARLVKLTLGENEALKIYAQALEQDPTNKVALAELAIIEYKMGEKTSAKAHAMQSLEIDHAQDSLLELVGKILEEQGHLDAAVLYYVEAIRVNPQVLEYYMNLCHLYQVRREYQEALNVCEKAMAILPHEIDPYLTASQILKEGKDYFGAEQMIRKAQEIEPDNVTIRRQLGAIIALNMVMSSQEVNSAL